MNHDGRSASRLGGSNVHCAGCGDSASNAVTSQVLRTGCASAGLSTINVTTDPARSARPKAKCAWTPDFTPRVEQDRHPLSIWTGQR